MDIQIASKLEAQVAGAFMLNMETKGCIPGVRDTASVMINYFGAQLKLGKAANDPEVFHTSIVVAAGMLAKLNRVCREALDAGADPIEAGSAVLVEALARLEEA
jgi:hypothetical protein